MTSYRRPPVLGVLGGMGPLATSHFYRLLVERTPAQADQEHVPVAIWADPSVPDRTAALIGGGPSPVPHLLAGLRWLQSANVACVAIPCNTAHAFREELVAASGMEILDMVEIALRAAIAVGRGVTRVGLIATAGTSHAGIYERAAHGLGVEIIAVAPHVQHRHVDPAIRAVKRGRGLDGARTAVAAAVRSLRSDGAEVVIGACTEIPLVAERATGVLPFVDSAASLADAALRRIDSLRGHGRGDDDQAPAVASASRTRPATFACSHRSDSDTPAPADGVNASTCQPAP